MDLLDRYLNAVSKGLPEAQREDIIRELSEDIVGEPAFLLPLLRIRGQLTLDEPAGGGTQLLVLGGEGRVGAHERRECPG